MRVEKTKLVIESGDGRNAWNGKLGRPVYQFKNYYGGYAQHWKKLIPRVVNAGSTIKHGGPCGRTNQTL